MKYNAMATLPVSVKNRNECSDYDYINKLSTEELDWLNGFHREWVNADFKHNFKKICKNEESKLHCFQMNNSRNRDIYSRLRGSKDLLLCKEVGKVRNVSKCYNWQLWEEVLIAQLDKK
jgi:hypothetical protein